MLCVNRCTTLKIIQQLVTSSDLIGPGLVPFYRQLLPVFNAYKMRNSMFYLCSQNGYALIEL